MIDDRKLPHISHHLEKMMSDHIFEFAENGINHNAYDQEFREQTAIENGDLEALTASLAEDKNGVVGTLAANPIRNLKNIGIVLITLASRSAIRGGLSPEIAFSLSDTFINEIELQTDPALLEELPRACEYQYCRMVRDIRMQKKGQYPHINPHVNQCKQYIFSHLHDKLTVRDLADSFNLNANYLSDLFRKYEGVSLSQYILREKINRAINLLIYSDYSYSDIALYLGFSSQSHLGTQFKKCTGYTLHQYRSIYKKIGKQ